jgi:hypothetical protein
MAAVAFAQPDGDASSARHQEFGWRSDWWRSRFLVGVVTMNPVMLFFFRLDSRPCSPPRRQPSADNDTSRAQLGTHDAADAGRHSWGQGTTADHPARAGLAHHHAPAAPLDSRRNADRARFFGRYLGREGDLLTLSSPRESGTRTVELRAIARLWIQDGAHVGRNAGAGALIGTVVIGALGYGLSGLEENGCSGWCAVPASMVGGAIFGGLVGAVVGMFPPRWRYAYPR